MGKPSDNYNIQALVMDFDGVHTDDTALIGSDGTEYATISRRDSAGLYDVRETGLPMLVLSRERSPIVKVRCRKLQIPCHAPCLDKFEVLDRWSVSHTITMGNICYLGNDNVDVDCMEAVGVSLCPVNSSPACKAAATFKLDKYHGGRGFVRVVCDWILAGAPTDFFGWEVYMYR